MKSEWSHLCAAVQLVKAFATMLLASCIHALYQMVRMKSVLPVVSKTSAPQVNKIVKKIQTPDTIVEFLSVCQAYILLFQIIAKGLI